MHSIRSGSGHGSGAGYGYGYGDGDGYGSGYGHGSGAGHGRGDGEFGQIVGVVDDYNVTHLSPWPYVKVGCQVNAVDAWRREWSSIAAEHDVEVEDAPVLEMIDRMEKKIHGLRSCG